MCPLSSHFFRGGGGGEGEGGYFCSFFLLGGWGVRIVLFVFCVFFGGAVLLRLTPHESTPVFFFGRGHLFEMSYNIGGWDWCLWDLNPRFL